MEEKWTDKWSSFSKQEGNFIQRVIDIIVNKWLK